MNRFQKIFDAQKILFATGVTRTYEWRVDQLDRMARMIGENERRFQEAMAKEFKTASQEYIFETQASMGESQVQKSQLKLRCLASWPKRDTRGWSIASRTAWRSSSGPSTDHCSCCSAPRLPRSQ